MCRGVFNTLYFYATAVKWNLTEQNIELAQAAARRDECTRVSSSIMEDL